MRTFRVSDQMYEQLKTFIVDPFDDTPELVIGRLIEIVNKAKARWAPFETPQAAARETTPEAEPLPKPRRKEPDARREQEIREEEGSPVVL
ncbi:MAG: hypothetical protein M1376_08565 [Planctomycetes bacterium]|nr:hypothetical protein [Planctomycetota bacterium]